MDRISIRAKSELPLRAHFRGSASGSSNWPGIAKIGDHETDVYRSHFPGRPAGCDLEAQSAACH
jgi:hypothetical protein